METDTFTSKVTNSEQERVVNDSDEEEDINEDEFGVKLAVRQDVKRRVWYAIGAAILLLIVSSAIVAVVYFGGYCKLKKGLNKNDAATHIEQLQMYDNISNITNIEQLDEFKKSFHAFDTDDDGYLTENEFKEFFKISLNHSKFFEKIDADNDGILSLVEVIAYQHELFKNDIVQNELKKYYKNLSISELNIMIEQIGINTFFGDDIDHIRDYITKNEFYERESNSEFVLFDLNGDGKISKKEFIIIMYDKYNKNSWVYYKLNGLNDTIKITPLTVRNTQVNFCYFNSGNGRRLGWTDNCRQVLRCSWKWVNGRQQYGCEYVIECSW